MNYCVNNPHKGDSDRGDKRLSKTHKKLRGVPLWVAAPTEHFHTRNENKS